MTAPAIRASRSEFLTLQSGRYHLREWGDPRAPLLLMLHGWMDTSGTFQFLVEALRGRWRIVAPDWLGCGLSEWRGRPYWLAELMLDLDAIADHLSPDAPLRVVGHGMGGNIASLWAGAKPQRLDRLVMLESFGHPKMTQEAVREQHARFLQDGRDGPADSSYATLAAFEARLRESNSRLSPEQASRISGWLARELPDGRFSVRVDPWHRNVFSHLIHQDEDFLSGWRRIEAPVLWVTADESTSLRRVTQSYGGEQELLARMAHFKRLQRIRVADAGHNLHHDQPRTLALAIEPFLLAGTFRDHVASYTGGFEQDYQDL